jgi:hypothetical protein
MAEAGRVRAIYRPEPGSRGWTTLVNLLAQVEMLTGNAAGAIDWIDSPSAAAGYHDRGIAQARPDLGAAPRRPAL